MQALGPGAHGQAQEVGGDLPVAGHLALHQRIDAVGAARLLQLQPVDEAGQGVGQLQGGPSVQRTVQQVLVLDHEPRQLESPPQGGHRGGQGQRRFAGLERRLAFVDVAQGADLRQQHGASAGGADESGGQLTRPAAGGEQHDRVGQGLGTVGGQRVPQPVGEIVEEGTVRGDGEPARALASQQAARRGRGGPRGRGAEQVERVGRRGHRASRASAASRAAGSPTCIQSPSITAPCSRPATAQSAQSGNRPKADSGRA